MVPSRTIASKRQNARRFEAEVEADPETERLKWHAFTIARPLPKIRTLAYGEAPVYDRGA